MSSPTLPVRRPLIGPRKREFKEHVRKTKLSIGALALFVLLCLALLYHGTPARMVAPSHKSVNTFSTGRLAKQHGNMFGTGDGATEAGSTQGDSLEDGTVVDSTALPTFETTVEDIPGPDVKQGNTDPEGRPTGAAIAEVSTSPLEKQGPVAHGTPYPGSFDELPFDEETRGRLIVYMQGEPKSGTTWLEMILDDMMDLYVKSHCTDCKIKGEIGENTRSIMNGQVSVSGVSFRNLVWSRRYKHSLAIDPKQQLKGAKAEGWVPLRGPAPGEILAGPYRQCFQWNLQRFWPNEPCPQLRPPPPLANRRFLCIVRDPRALIVSGFHYFNHHGRKKLTDYVADHAVGTIVRVAMRYHWFTQVVDQRIALVLRYHEMKADPLYNFLEIAHFMGMDLTTEEVKVVMDKTSVSAMHKLESQGGLPHVNRAGKEDAKVRSGTTDEWRQEITGKDLAFVNKAMVDNMPKVMIDEFFSAEDKLSMKH